MSEENAKPERRLTSLWLLIALTVAPVLASYVAYYFWQPSRQGNYGELLEPRPLPDSKLTPAAGSDILKLLPVAGSVADHIYVVDPLGNLMMRYPRDADPLRMLKDVARL